MSVYWWATLAGADTAAVRVESAGDAALAELGLEAGLSRPPTVVASTATR